MNLKKLLILSLLWTPSLLLFTHCGKIELDPELTGVPPASSPTTSQVDTREVRDRSTATTPTPKSSNPYSNAINRAKDVRSQVEENRTNLDSEF